MKQYKLRQFEFIGNNGYKVTISAHCSSSDMEGCGNKVRGRLQADPSTSNKNPISNDTSYSNQTHALYAYIRLHRVNNNGKKINTKTNL